MVTTQQDQRRRSPDRPVSLDDGASPEEVEEEEEKEEEKEEEDKEEKGIGEDSLGTDRGRKWLEAARLAHESSNSSASARHTMRRPLVRVV